jgi:ribonuclease P protein subunit POP4
MMLISPDNLIHHELIGLEVEVIDSTNISLIGIKGMVLDETKNTLKIEVGSRQLKLVPKSHTHFIFTIPASTGRRYLPDKNVRVKVDGRLLLSQPENRIQTKFKKSFTRLKNV